jgi:hypothetical protein
MLALADMANDTGMCWPSLPTLVKRTRFSRRAVLRAIVRLEHGGRLTREGRQAKTGRQLSNWYTVHAPAVIVGPVTPPGWNPTLSNPARGARAAPSTVPERHPPYRGGGCQSGTQTIRNPNKKTGLEVDMSPEDPLTAAYQAALVTEYDRAFAAYTSAKHGLAQAYILGGMKVTQAYASAAEKLADLRPEPEEP